ncbi:hypothetical protein Hanom_Chr08g00728191 [Helianthus anomalus]
MTDGTSPVGEVCQVVSSYIDWLCVGHCIDQYSGLVVPDDKVPARKCLESKIVLYACILEQTNLRCLYSNFFLEVLKYYHLSLRQLAPIGVERIMHFEITCQKTQCEVALITRTAGFTSSWKDWFFFVSDALIPFAISWCKFYSSLIEKEPKPSNLELYFYHEEFLCFRD